MSFMNWYKPSSAVALTEELAKALRWWAFEPFKQTAPVWLMPIDVAFDEVRKWTYRDDDLRREDFGYSRIVAIHDAMTYFTDHDIPPAVMKSGKLVDGKHRIIAARLRGFKHVPVIRIEDCIKER